MKVLITGHAGFIGSHMWDLCVKDGHDVYGLDDLSRSTSKPRHDPQSIVGDVVGIRAIEQLDQDFDWVIHLAGQVSVVSGEKYPDRDFHSNSLGTFAVVQWAKERNAGVIFSSSNKVFGELRGVSTPIADTQPLNPQTNYGVSKAAASHYVADYSKGWVFHQSCVYGSTQQGEVDQGWIGWLNQSIRGSRSITCFGDGSQVRDLLHVDDLVRLYRSVLNGDVPRGSYVLGGGVENAVTFSEAVSNLGGEITEFAAWRPHDQRYFVSANSGLAALGWRPSIGREQGLEQMT